MKLIKTISENTLQNNWREAILKKQGRCFFCGNAKKDQLQVCRIIEKNNILKWNINNGIVVCDCIHMLNKGLFKNKKTCLEFASSPEGKIRIYKSIDEKFLNDNNLISFEDYLLELNMKKREFFFFQNEGLKAVING